MTSVISKQDWGVYEHHAVSLFRIKNSRGAYVELTNFGASIVSVVVPDRTGHFDSVVLGFPQLQGYIEDTCYLGATIGQYANRIAFAEFELEGHQYCLEPNDGHHTNHGGTDGFHKRMFSATVNDHSISFHLISPDGAGGFPGNLRFSVHYSWNDANELIIQYQATSDKKTLLNVTNHAYFNLSGGKTTIQSHNLEVYASHVLEATADYIPTGIRKPYPNPAFSNIKELNQYHILPETTQPRRKKAALLHHAGSGRTLEVYTTYPGLMVYSGDFLTSDAPGHAGRPYGPLDGLCLECQYFPDSPHHPGFPSTVLDAGVVYQEQIVYKFNVSPQESTYQR